MDRCSKETVAEGLLHEVHELRKCFKTSKDPKKRETKPKLNGLKLLGRKKSN